MKTLAAIKNDLFKDYIKLVSTDNLEATLDNPSVPVPFVCVAAVENTNADALAEELNRFFAHRKLKNKDFLVVDEADLAQLSFLFNLIQLSGGGKAMQTVAPVAKESKPMVEAPTVVELETPAVEVSVVEAVTEIKDVTEVVVVTEVEAEAIPASEVASESSVKEEVVSVSVEAGGEMIEALNIPKNSTIHFIKDETVTATLVDEKTVVYEGEETSLIEATRKVFKKTGAGGMATGLANWNYEGKSLKSLKEQN